MSDPTATTSQSNQPLSVSRTQRLGGLSVAAQLAMFVRAGAALALTVPVICGVALGWWDQESVNLIGAIFAIMGAFTGVLSINALWEYIDYRRGLPIDHYEARLLPDSGYSLMRSGRIDPIFTRNVGVILGIAGLICGLLLGLLAGWPMLLFALAGYGLAFLYAGPPLRYGYRGWGLGEVGIFISFGLLTTASGFYGATGYLTSTVPFAAIPLGLLAMLVVFNYNVLRYRRDWLIRKRTLVVSLGMARGIDAGVALTIATYGAFVIMASAGHLPLWTLLSLGGLPIVLGAYSAIWRSKRPTDDLSALYQATLNAAIGTGILFCLGLWLDKILQ
ncbi:MAG: prenyltransferase [Caldilineaceae bacterium]|nr:prenyltransferase [Caldilineaceae bacterium]